MSDEDSRIKVAVAANYLDAGGILRGDELDVAFWECANANTHIYCKSRPSTVLSLQIALKDLGFQDLGHDDSNKTNRPKYRHFSCAAGKRQVQDALLSHSDFVFV